MPLQMASARPLSVRTCRPGRSEVRSCISWRAFTLNATRHTVAGDTPRSAMRCRARSVSTRVLPEPAGATMRAAARRDDTAANWSGARSALGEAAVSGVSRPAVRWARGTTGTPLVSPGGNASSGPPSHQSASPAASTTSPMQSAGAIVAPLRMAASTAAMVGEAGSRASTELEKTRW